MKMNVDAFVEAVTDNGDTLTVQSSMSDMTGLITVKKQDGLDVKEQDGVRVTFNLATAALDTESGATFFRNQKPYATAKFAL